MANPPFNVDGVDKDAARRTTSALPLRPAERRQRQLPLDPAVLLRAERDRAGPASSWRTRPRDARGSELEIRKQADRGRRGRCDGAVGPNFFYTVTLPVHALVPRQGQGARTARATRCCSSTPATSSARSTARTATSRPSRSSSSPTSCGFGAVPEIFLIDRSSAEIEVEFSGWQVSRRAGSVPARGPQGDRRRKAGASIPAVMWAWRPARPI